MDSLFCTVRNIEISILCPVYDGACVAMSGTMMNPGSVTLFWVIESNSIPASLIRKHTLTTDIYLSDPNSSVGSHNELFSYFVAPKRDVFNLSVYSYPSGRQNS